ncbi:MAG: hypothetical protein IPK26_11680 [Planctomycetes bacterium]|nr:hypothetical protein [Planctomycetota bacterium]
MKPRWVGDVSVIVVLAALTRGILAQHAAVGWGWLHFDSRAHEMACSQVAASGAGTMAILTGGNATFWGLNQGLMPMVPSGTQVVEVALGGGDYPGFPLPFPFVNWVARLADGSLLASGGAPSFPSGTQPVAVAAGAGHQAALLSNGGILVWGSDYYGIQQVPDPGPGREFVRISSGSVHMLAVRSDGQAVCWGFNGHGQCNAPTVPTPVVILDVSGGVSHSLAVRSDGRIAAWGDNSFGQCNVPAPPVGLSFTRTSAGAGHSLALLSDGSVVAWGDNSRGQCNVPPVPAGLAVVEIDAGDYHNVMRLSDGSIQCWGDTRWMKCNLPATPSGVEWVDVAVGQDHVAGLTSDGQVVAWNCSNGSVCDVPPLPAGRRYVSLDPRGQAAVRSDGTAVVWGGPGAPPPVPGTRFVEVATSGDFGAALASDGSLVAWGDAGSGPLQVPPLPAGLRYLRFVVRGNTGLATRSDGSLVAWGGFGLPPLLPQGPGWDRIAAGDGGIGLTRYDGSGIVEGGLLHFSFPGSEPAHRFAQIAVGAGHYWLLRRDGALASLTSSMSVPTGALLPPLSPDHAFHRVAAFGRQCAGLIGQAGSRPLGRGTSGCSGVSVAIANGVPRLGNLEFGLTCRNLSPGTAAVRVLSPATTERGSVDVAGVELWLSPSVALDATVWVVGADGAVATPLPVPAISALVGTTLGAQFLCLEPPGCVLRPISASSAIEVVVRP